MLQSYTTIDQLSTPNGGRTLREKCPVHGGKKKSVAVWWNNGPRAYCHSHQCSQTEILAGLGITSSQPFAWTPPPPPRLRSTISAKPLLPVTPIQGRAYLAGIPANRREWIQYQRQDGLLGWHWRQGSDGGIVTIQTASTTRASDSGGCGASFACVQPGTDGNSSGPGKHMLNMTMVFEQPGFQCDNDPCSIQSEVLWTDVRSMHRTQPMSSTVANPQLYIFIDYIMLHEFGHTLGLPDFYADTTGLKNVVAIMNDSGAARNVKDEDIEQLRAIYILHTRH